MKTIISRISIAPLLFLLLSFAVGCSSYPSSLDAATPAPPPIATLQIEQSAQATDVVIVVATDAPTPVPVEPTAPPPTPIPQPPPTELPAPTAEVIAVEPEAVAENTEAVAETSAEASNEDSAEAPAAEVVVDEAVDSAENPTPPPPAEEPTPVPPLSIALSAPIQNARVVAGTALSVSGEATSVEVGQSILVELIQQNVGTMRDVNLVAQDGRWSALLPAPEDVVGPMLVKASIRDAAGNTLAEATTPVELVVNEGSAENYIQINTISPIAIAGQGIHLTGTASSINPVFKVNLGIFYNNCSETAGLVSFDMYSNGYWEGYLTLPEFATGEICVYAFTGELGGPDQRLTQIPIVAMEPDDENAVGVVIANPRPGNSVYAPLNVDGIAYNAPNGVVTVVARLPNGTILWEDRVFPDRFGYWQSYVPIGDGDYPAEIVASIGDANNPIQATHSINIIPAGGSVAPAESVTIEEFPAEEAPAAEESAETTDG